MTVNDPCNTICNTYLDIYGQYGLVKTCSSIVNVTDCGGNRIDNIHHNDTCCTKILHLY
jgi:hypothetical protein